MINTPSIRDLMMDGERIGEIRDFIASGREQYGMQTFDQCLADLVRSDVVTFEVAKAAASNPSDFELQMKMFSGDSSGGGSGARTNGQKATEPKEEEETPPPPVEAALDGLQTGGLDFLAQ
jgi:twitching motility protein PilT